MCTAAPGIIAGDSQAIIFCLRTIGKKRGYTEKVEAPNFEDMVIKIGYSDDEDE